MGYNTDFTGIITPTPPLPADFDLGALGARDLNYHCCWAIDADGDIVTANDEERCYEHAEWLQVIIDHFPDHTFGGMVEAQGDGTDDRWAIRIANDGRTVETADGEVVYSSWGALT